MATSRSASGSGLARAAGLAFVLIASVVLAPGASLAAPARAAILAGAADAQGSFAPAADAEDVNVEFSVGLGWALCPDSPKMPPLETATSCEGLLVSLDDVALTLTPQPTSNPEWKLWSAKLLRKTKFKNLEGTLEILASYAKVDGKTYAFMEGRLFTSATGKQATYFGGTASDFSQLQLTTAYGPFVPISFGSQKDLWVPYMSFARKGYGSEAGLGTQGARVQLPRISETKAL